MAPAMELPLASWRVPRQEASCPAEDQGTQTRRKKARAIRMRITATASNYSVHFQTRIGPQIRCLKREVGPVGDWAEICRAA